MIKVHKAFESCALKFINGLVVIADNKNIGVIPKANQLRQNFILRAIRVLIFIHQKVKVLLLIIAQKKLKFLKSINHPKYHVIKIVAAMPPQYFLKNWV